MSNTQPLLTPFQSKQLQRSLEIESSPEYRRRLEIMLLADAGYSQAQICAKLGCAHATARYWIAVAQAGNAHHWNDRPMGRPKTVSPEFLERLRALVTDSPRHYGYSFQRWTAAWLAKQLEKELGIKVSGRYINQLLKQIGLSTREPFTAPRDAIDANGNPDISTATRITIRDLRSTMAPKTEWQMNQIKIS